MNVLICSSAKENIDPYYLSIASSISSYLARNDCDLVYGAGDSSMMGICYREFKKYDRNIMAFSNQKYIDSLNNLDCSKLICSDTFDLKKNMFEVSNIVVILPGGLGTISELISFIEEKRSNDITKPIIIYNEGHFFDKLFMYLDELINEKFIDSDIKNLYTIANNKEEFEEAFWVSKIGGKKK